MFNRLKWLFGTFIAVVSLCFIQFNAAVYAAELPKEQYNVTPGVVYKDYRFSMNSLVQAARVLEVDLSLPQVKMEAGIPSPLTSLATVSSRAKSNTYNQHHVVGAVNASFFHTKSKLPAYLVSWKRDVSTLGVISTGLDEYMSVPTAFGVSGQGTGQIDTFSYDSQFMVNGTNAKISSINKERGSSEIIVYTPTYSYPSTRTNTYGMEIVVTNASADLDTGIEFGKPITGIVQSVKPYGQGNSEIPANGYVISIQGGAKSAQFANVKAGEKIDLTIDVDNRWKDSEFMIASGPMLVKDGKVNMTISETSARAKERAPRTAVAMDRTGKRIFMVTVDGRQPGYSTGMTLKELAQYLVSIGADRAINLDGGGSTAMAVRNAGNIYPTLKNSPSDGAERAVSVILQVVSTAPYGEPAAFEFKKSTEATLLKGSAVELQPLYALDNNNHRLAVDPAKVQYSVEGNVGVIEGNRFVASKEGTGYIVGRYGTGVKKVPVSVTETPAKVTVSPGSAVIAPGEKMKFTAKAFDEKGAELSAAPGTIKWWATNGAGTMSPDGTFTAGDANASGQIQATIFNTRGSSGVTVGSKAEIISSFEKLSEWKAESARASSSLFLSSPSEPRHHGNGSLKLKYDFSAGEAGIAASYAALQEPIPLSGRPHYIGVWVYGDGKNHWLRGKLIDGAGGEYTINFTEESKLNWKGWKYVRAAVPAQISLPLKFSKIYAAESYSENQGSGVLYFDKIQAEYGNSYYEPIFNDVSNSHWAKTEIAYLTENEILTGYTDGTFKPENKLSRAHAAVLLTRILKLPADSTFKLGYQDVGTENIYYREIAAVTKAGIMTGSNNNTLFNPDGTLTRAQMSAILTRAYNLKGSITQPFNDVPPEFWAFEDIHALAANNITTGYEDHTFKPNNPVTRGQFSAFLYRINKR
ncbi:phosphodiester glycosidase family protein [Bacillus infantis]|uniref:phosphodiester glycosidase family protein n=1 Tax=Bacillus infantis TaxID=324767 RepID=UPI003CF6337D